VIEPAGVVPDYNPELFDRDAAALDLQNASEALVLNIVSLRNQTRWTLR
jgi:flagellar assembly factor FliW